MPFNATQLASGANYSIKTFQKKDPIDQVNFQHATLDYLIKNKQVSTFGNGSFKEPVFTGNNSNYQNYFGADAVTYNERDPGNFTDFTWFNNHDGFWFDEDRLVAAGIFITEDRQAVPSAGEKETLINLLQVSYKGLKMGVQEQMAYELLRDGSQSAKACPGLASIVSRTPNAGTIGGINAATYTYWQNNASLGVAAGSIIPQMDQQFRACMRYGGSKPDFLVCGAAFLDNYIAQAGLTVNRQITGGSNSRGGVTIDPGVTGVFYKGLELIWDPTFEALDTLLGTTTQTKSAYFLNKDAVTLRPVKNNWMVERKPERLPDRYVYYFGSTSKYSLTSNKRNALSVLSIA